jgi:protein required for attachment to host cells
MRVRILVADEREASFFDVQGLNAPMRLIAKFENETAQLHDRDLETDKPGRAFDRMGTGRHAMDGERSARRQNQSRFAECIAEEIETAWNRNGFDRLVIMAGPRMLGLIREALTGRNAPVIAAEISKDLAHVDVDTIRNYVPREAFSEIAFTPR